MTCAARSKAAAAYVLLVCLLSACVTVTSQAVPVREGEIENRYAQIRQIVIEEAANNGYGQPTQEVKPSTYNNWRGILAFRVQTLHGHDNLQVRVERQGSELVLKFVAAGAVANADSAVKAIKARVAQLQ